MFLKKLSIYLLGIFELILFFWLVKQPGSIWYVIGISVGLLFLISNFIIAKKLPYKQVLIFFSLILLLTLAGILFLLIVEALYLKYLIVLLIPFLIAVYWQIIFNYLYAGNKYQPFSLNRFFEYSSLLIIFFSTSGLFAWYTFLNFKFWILSIVLSILAVILMLFNFWINKFEFKKNLYYLLIFVLLFFELSVLIGWLPLSYFIKGFLLAVFYFLFISFSNRKIKQIWESKKIIWWSLISLIIVLIILISARWF